MEQNVSPFLQILSQGLSDFGIISGWLFFGLLATWALFSAVLVYHWFKYNLGSSLTPVALAAYGFASLALIGFTATGL